ncbi:hypothetical protein QQS21_003942 [Conoideocrella luteorostrata]|uniref:Uncharacterized protein n=1 Tax=Conoideocrella luteorostrata TaxID=1105319 RepID=A0AAJ0CSH5_9HYPO|nr:hypothetical protein QQS21_003942 [Conoideocrella luteorostrata]
MSKKDAGTISIQQEDALMKFFDGKIGEGDISKASPKVTAEITKEFQNLVAMNMGLNLKYSKPSEDRNLHFFPTNNPASTIASVLGLLEQDVKAVAGK